MNENENNPLINDDSEQRNDDNEILTELPDAMPQGIGETEEPPAQQIAEEETSDAIQQTETAEEPTVVYRWDYAAQAAEDARRTTQTRRSGALTFAIVMSGCFLLTLLVLIAALISGGTFGPSRAGDDLYSDGTVDISDGNGDALTLQQISEKGNEVVVAVTVKTAAGVGSGTGIIMTEDGYIATNQHVIENATEITVQLYDGSKYTATLVGSSAIDDLAVLKIEKKGLPVAVFGDSSKVSVGDRTVVIGHPAGLIFGWTSTYGFVSAINRDVMIRNYYGTLVKKMTLLQTDANVNKGNSGGPMFNDRGEVIGIITMKLVGNYEGMGFAIPSNVAVPLLETLMKTGSADGTQPEVSSQRPQLGITGVDVEGGQWYVMMGRYLLSLTEEQASEIEQSFYAETTGVHILTVVEEADAFGKIQPGDIITALDGNEILTMTALREYLSKLSIGDTVETTVVREGQQLTVSVVLTASSE